MSTESGLPDFRSAQGLWKTKDPTFYASIEALEHHREDFIAFYKSRIAGIRRYAPHDGHRILAKWEQLGLVRAIITQNVDGFHQLAGSMNVMELHGSLDKLYCMQCGTRYGGERYIMSEGEQCVCGGLIRPSVVLFGEDLPELAVHRAIHEAEHCDVFIVMGSSLQVSPANQLPLMAMENGATIVIVNMYPTPLDPYADLVINERKIGDVLREADGMLGKEGVVVCNRLGQ